MRDRDDYDRDSRRPAAGDQARWGTQDREGSERDPSGRLGADRVNEFGGEDTQREYQRQGGWSESARGGYEHGQGEYGGQARYGGGAAGQSSGQQGRTGRVNEFGGAHTRDDRDMNAPRGAGPMGGRPLSDSTGRMGEHEWSGRHEPTGGGSDYRTGGTDWMGGAMSDYAGPRVRRGPKNWTRSDDRIRDDLCERLSHMHDIDASDVSVTVH